MKVAFFSKIPVFPAHGGNRARIKNLCEALKRHGCEIDFFLIPSRQMRDFDKPSHEEFFGSSKMNVMNRNVIHTLLFFCKAYYWLIVGRMFNVMGFGAKNSNVDYLFPSGLGPQFARIARDGQYGMCIVSYVHFSKIFEYFSDKTYKVLDTHDSFASEFSTQAENKGFLRADTVLAIQEDEATVFRQQLGVHDSKIRVLSHFIEPKDTVILKNTKGATFIGSSFAANIVSLKYFIDKILPLIVERLSEFKLYVAGSVCSDIADNPNIVKLGRVDQVFDVFALAPILVNPIRAGTGVKIKLLEAMSMGVPTVSTVTGVRGLDQQFLAGVVVVDDTDTASFAAEVIELCVNSEERRRMGDLAMGCAQRWAAQQELRVRELLVDAGKANSS